MALYSVSTSVYCTHGRVPRALGPLRRRAWRDGTRVEWPGPSAGLLSSACVAWDITARDVFPFEA